MTKHAGLNMAFSEHENVKCPYNEQPAESVKVSEIW